MLSVKGIGDKKIARFAKHFVKNEEHEETRTPD